MSLTLTGAGQGAEAAAQTFSQVVLAEPTLLSYWRLNEPSGTSAADSKGVNTGTYVNAPTLGVAGLTSDGATAVQFVAASLNELTLPGPVVSVNYAWECWFKWTAGAVIMRDDTSAAGTIIGLDGGTFFSARISGTDCATTKTVAQARDGARHHLVVSKTGANAEIIFDGVSVATPSGLGNTASTAPYHVAKNGPSGAYSDCVVDEIAVYSAALSAAQALTHFNAR